MTISTFFNKAFAFVERKLAYPWLNPFATVYLNFRTLPFVQALRFPLYVYGRVKFYELKGKILLRGGVKRGLIKFGRHDDIYSLSSKNVLHLADGSKIVFNGPCSVGAGFLWRIDRDAIFEVGRLARFGTCVKVICSNHIVFGDYSSITFKCMMMDTNSHYTINLNDYSVRRLNAKTIEIGAKNWIGNNTQVFLGAKTGEGCIIGHGSMLNHNFSDTYNSLLAGSPAVVKQDNITRCFSFTRENELNDFFKRNPDKSVKFYDTSYEDPLEDLIRFFE